MTGNWVWLISDVNGLPHRVPDDPAVIAAHVGRGFELTDLPGDWNSDDEEFIAALEERQADTAELGDELPKEQRLEDPAATPPSGVQPEGNEN